MKLPALSEALLLICGCAALETGADRARNFAARHPVVTAVGAAVVVVGGSVALSRHGGPGTSGCVAYYERQGASLTEAEHDCDSVPKRRPCANTAERLAHTKPSRSRDRPVKRPRRPSSERGLKAAHTALRAN